MRMQSGLFSCAVIGVLAAITTPLSRAADEWYRLTPPPSANWSKSYSVDVVMPPLARGKNGSRHRVRVQRGEFANNDGNIAVNTYIVSEMTAICDEKHIASIEFGKVALAPVLGNTPIAQTQRAPAQQVLDKIASDAWLQTALCDNYEKSLKKILPPKLSEAEEKRQRDLPMRAARAMECGKSKPNVGVINEVLNQDTGVPNMKAGQKYSKLYKVNKDLRPYGFRVRSYAIAADAQKNSFTFRRGVFLEASVADVLEALKKQQMVIGNGTLDTKPIRSWIALQPDPVKRWNFKMPAPNVNAFSGKEWKAQGRVSVDETSEGGVVLVACEYKITPV